MTFDRREMHRLLGGLLDLPAGERPAAIEAACEDEALRGHVLRLLEGVGEPEADGELDPESGWTASLWSELAAEVAERETPIREGALVGPYRILEEIERGGMAVVYRAERVDGEVTREVAIKVLKLGLDTEEVIRRFEQERQILADLDHPNIARLYDAGHTEDGRPYFVMELVEGAPIDRFCDERRLSVTERLELFRVVTGAVEYAHQNLVVHRDLKPSNILVNRAGQVKLLDFGIARLLDVEAGGGAGAALTRAMVRMMTPEYASPEQVRGERVATASDVYQLGVLLYELLTGDRPYVLGDCSVGAIERAICEQVPTRPSTAVARGETLKRPTSVSAGVDAQVDAERLERAQPSRDAGANVEAICEARRTTPSRLRRRLRGDLDNIVLQALRKEPERRYRTADRLAQDIRRHLEGLPVTARADTWSYRGRKFLARHAIAASAAAAMLVLVTGLTAFYLARIQGERDRVQAEAVKAEQMNQFLTGLFESADPREALGAELTARELLDRGVREVDHELAGQPEVQAQMLQVLGRTYLELGVHDAAEDLLQRSLELRRDRLPSGHPEIAHALAYLGFLRYRQGEYEQARELLQSAIRDLEAAPDEEGSRLVDALHSLGSAYMRLHRYEESRASIERALRLQEELSGSDSVPAAQLLHTLGSLQSKTGDLDRAERLYQRVATIYERELRPGDPRVGYVLSDLATTRLKRGRLEGLEPMYRRSLAILEGAYGPDNDRLAITLNALGSLLIAEGRNAEAVDILRRALAVQSTGGETDHPQAAYPLSSLGDAYRAEGRLREARGSYRRATAILERARENGAFDPVLASSLVNLGFIEEALGDRSAAEQLLRRALAIWRHAPDGVDPQLAPALLDLGRWLAERGRCAEAVPMLHRVARIHRATQHAASSRATELESLLAGCSEERSAKQVQGTGS